MNKKHFYSSVYQITIAIVSGLFLSACLLASCQLISWADFSFLHRSSFDEL